MRGILFKPYLFPLVVSGQKDVTRRGHNLKEINVDPDRWEVLSQEIIPYTNMYSAYFLNTLATTRTVRSVKARFKVGETLFMAEPHWVHKEHPLNPGLVHYTFDYPRTDMPEYFKEGRRKFVSPMLMREIFARHFVKVKSIRLERLHQITEEDAKREGVLQNRDGSWHDYLEPTRLSQDSARASFISLFQKVNGASGWEKNSYVWRYELEYLHQPKR